MRGSYKTWIGLEIHLHLKTDSKMFCSCPARYGDEANRNVCPVCMGYPGALPRLNERAMELGYLMARALNCRLSAKTFFARKNYFYPDMPKNYQISQFEDPVGTEGFILADLGEVGERSIRIHDVHLEEDAGKMIHAGDVSLLDFNRAGYPLLEVVTEPDLYSGEETEAFLRDFQRLVRRLGVSDGNMEEGSMKCDANISINPEGKGLGTKVELKNMNSPRFVRLALNYETARQAAMLKDGGTIIQETRLWNENRDVTETMRRKETSDDYRYFPEPDIPPFVPDEAFFSRIEKGLVELPLALKKRLVAEYGLTPDLADFIRDDEAVARLFEETVSLGSSPRDVAAWLSSDVRKVLNREGRGLAGSPLTAARFHELLSLIAEGSISGKIAKGVLDRVFQDGEDPAAIVKAEGWAQITDTGQIAEFVDRVLEANPQVAEAVRTGDMRQRGWLMGQIMRLSEGKASPEMAQRILDKKLLDE
ncbi:MAG: glutaminyl-tRNA synthase (glutamine-hydrolyzing) subunit B [Spirochaeta sp. LUC14_002_19_P3]|nr:MAG: glutaminyl-tRNA synthase (glutamine-hydrolyzing) subunit B [Spirochaeta sp. LUC14_002_19_P3]